MEYIHKKLLKKLFLKDLDLKKILKNLKFITTNKKFILRKKLKNLILAKGKLLNQEGPMNKKKNKQEKPMTLKIIFERYGSSRTS